MKCLKLKKIKDPGKIKRKFEGQQMEFRCSTAPAKYGEKLVKQIRVLALGRYKIHRKDKKGDS